MKKILFLTVLGCVYSMNIFAATYYEINTKSPLFCHLSSKFQNRIMIENGRIKKVVSTDSERLSIQIEDITGQAFLYLRDPNIDEISISIVSDTGVIQDIHVNFIDRMAEVIILEYPEKEICKICEIQDDQQIAKSLTLNKIEAILSGSIPQGYCVSAVTSGKWVLKKGIELEPKSILEGFDEIIYVYQVKNTLKQQQTLLECELECIGSSWVYLETNTLYGKQKALGIVAVKRT